jgi:cytidylate kinase
LNSILAIDGPSASGKSTVARRVAEALGFAYVDSGAVYRGVTWQLLRRGVEPRDSGAVARCLRDLAFEHYRAGNAIRFRIDGEDPGEELRSAPVRENVSAVAALPDVRAAVNGWLRESARFGNLVMEGRDIGTVVFPGTPLKFFLDADPEERARRRHAELVQRRENVPVESVRDSLQRRDALDSERAAAPLRVATGATVINTTGIGIDAVVARILERVRAADSLSC